MQQSTHSTVRGSESALLSAHKSRCDSNANRICAGLESKPHAQALSNQTPSHSAQRRWDQNDTSAQHNTQHQHNINTNQPQNIALYRERGRERERENAYSEQIAKHRFSRFRRITCNTQSNQIKSNQRIQSHTPHHTHTTPHHRAD